MKISPRIELIEDGFGNSNKETIPFLLLSVEDFFRRQGVASEKRVCVKRHPQGPMCCLTTDDSIHNILLDTEDSRLCQWVYQYGHEYCHHLIDGGLTGNTAGLKWFEESLCHVASYVCLNDIERLSVVTPLLKPYTIRYILYLGELLKEEGKPLYEQYLPSPNDPLRKKQIPQEEIKLIYPYVESKVDVLATTYSMEDYKAIARMLFPHFYNNPKLWSILPHLGDTCKWNSLQSLFDHLQEKADDEYRESLEGLKKCMIAE